MKKIILLSIICIAIFIILTGCIVAHRPDTIYILDNNQPPRPVITTAPPTVTAIEAQPELVVVETIPEVYYVKSTPNMFCYSNLWWYYYGGFWYRSSSHHGPWVSIEVSSVPHHFSRIPEHHFQHAGSPPRYEQKGREDDHRDREDHQNRGKKNKR